MLDAQKETRHDRDGDLDIVARRLRQVYFERIDSIEEHQVNNWHGDRFFKFCSDGHTYLARMIDCVRIYRTSPQQFVSDDMLRAQLSVCAEFGRYGLPYLQLIRPRVSAALWCELSVADRNVRLVVFRWVDGQSLASVNAAQAAQIGYWLGRSHAAPAAAADVHATALPHSHDYELHAHWIGDIRRALIGQPQLQAVLEDYLKDCDERIAFLRQHLDTPRIIVHGDFNLPNVLWSGNGESVDTIIDFDQIGLARGIEDLAWVVKWYALRSEPQHMHENLRSLLTQYLSQRALSIAEWRCLPSLLWLNSGVNYNFVLKVVRGINTLAVTELREQLQMLTQSYRVRSEKMSGLGSRLAEDFLQIGAAGPVQR